MTPAQQSFLDQYLATLSKAERDTIPQIIAEHFCGDQYNANECARLIAANIKTASCSLKAAYDIAGESPPQVGQLTVVLNWAQQPVCIVKLTDVSICPFNQVSEEFARAEGEGDGSYQWWRAAHIDFFNDYGQQIGVTFSEHAELILERFQKVFPQ